MNTPLFTYLAEILSVTRETPAQIKIYEIGKIHGFTELDLDEEALRISNLKKDRIIYGKIVDTYPRSRHYPSKDVMDLINKEVEA